MADSRNTAFTGTASIASILVSCAVVKNNTGGVKRVVALRDAAELLTHRSNGRNLKEYLNARNLQPYLPARFRQGMPTPYVKYRRNGRLIEGIQMEDLLAISRMYISAYKDGTLHRSQHHIANLATRVIEDFRKVPAEQVIDDATGYKDACIRFEVEKILLKMLPHLTGSFVIASPLELYKQWFRLNNWDWNEENVKSKPGFLSKWIQELVYERVSPSVLARPDKRDPGNPTRHYNTVEYSAKQHENPAVKEFFSGLISLAAATANWHKYCELVNKAYPKQDNEIIEAVDDTPEVELLSFY